MSKPFARAIALMAAFAAAITSGVGVDAARAAAAGYTSNGHSGKRAHGPTGIAGVRRASLKARNVKANRRAHK